VSSPAFGDDIQWRACELVVHRQRGRRSEPLPLPVDIGEAITAYLRDGRPGSAQDRSLFVRVKVPRHGLTTGRITQVAAAPARGARQIQVHRLRHSAATLMLRAWAPLGEIGQVLRHRAALTTAMYAKGRSRPRCARWPARGRERGREFARATPR
jgi:integrase/recombinase XerD